MGCRRSGEPESPGSSHSAGTPRLSGPRDRQRRRVYEWEDRVVAPRDRTQIFFPAAQAMVDAIWADLALRYPPAVEMMSRNATGTLARADRLSLLLPEHTPSWCLLHELAHAMTTLEDGRSDGHGPTFMGIYVRLLVRYLRFDEADLILSLKEAGIRNDPKAKPTFADP